MDLQEIFKSLQVLWEQSPGAVLLLILGLLVFVFLVVDAWRHKHKRKKPKWRP